MIWSQRHTPILRANQQGLWAEGTVTKKTGGSLTLYEHVDASCYCLLGLLFSCLAIVKGGYHHSEHFYLSSRVQVWTLLFSFLPSLNYQGINIWGSMC